MPVLENENIVIKPEKPDDTHTHRYVYVKKTNKYRKTLIKTKKEDVAPIKHV